MTAYACKEQAYCESLWVGEVGWATARIEGFPDRVLKAAEHLSAARVSHSVPCKTHPYLWQYIRIDLPHPVRQDAGERG